MSLEEQRVEKTNQSLEKVIDLIKTSIRTADAIEMEIERLKRDTQLPNNGLPSPAKDD